MVSSLQEHPQTFDEFEQLQEFVQNTMSEESATMIKLQSICGVGLKVVETHLKSCERRAEMIEEDVKTLNLLEDQNENWKNEVLKDLEGQLQTVDSSLRDVVDRADEFFEDEFQITNIVSLLSGQKDGLERKFEAQVLGDSLRLVDDRTNNLVDWLMRKRSNQMRYACKFLDDRVNRRRRFSSNDELTDAMQNQIVVRKAYVYIFFCSNDITYTSSLNHSYVEDAKNATSEKTMCVNDMQSEFISKVSAGVMTSVGLQASALGVSGLVAVAMLDWTGLLASGTLLVGGLGFLPYRRSVVKKQFRERMNHVREEVRSALRDRSSIVLEESREKMSSSIDPFRNFLSNERVENESMIKELSDIEEGLS